MIANIDAYFEKKWVSSASCITSVSPYYVEKISNFTKIKGSVILNGFFEEEFNHLEKYKLYDDFTMTYNGTLYPTQNIEIFIEGFKQAVQELKLKQKKVKLLFPGSAFKPDQANRVKILLAGYEDYYQITNRIPRSEVMEIQQKSHVLLMFPHTGIKGIPSSKLYEYLGLNKYILICPSDNDILESTINETGNGIICKTDIEVKEFILDAVLNFKHLNSQLDFKKNLKFTREEQTKLLSIILNEI